LLEAGLHSDGVDYRLRVGRLRALHRGVYLVGPILPPHGAEMAALLACGAGAVLSDFSAAVICELLAPIKTAPCEVTVPPGKRSMHPKIRIHVRMLSKDEFTTQHGLRVTTVPRTLLDLAATAPLRSFERALAQALRSGATKTEELSALVARYPRRRGTARLQRALGGTGPAYTRSPAEDRLLALTRKARLREPEANVRVAGHEVDFFWRAERLVLEIDGFAFHSSAEKFESDRSRDADLAAAGARVMRATWRQLAEQPEALLVRLAQALARAEP
jgi:very-short-patch-repair endonuclease